MFFLEGGAFEEGRAAREGARARSDRRRPFFFDCRARPGAQEARNWAEPRRRAAGTARHGARGSLSHPRERAIEKKARGCPRPPPHPPAPRPSAPSALSYLDLRQLHLALQLLEAGVQVAPARRARVVAVVRRGRARRRRGRAVHVHALLGRQGAFDLHGEEGREGWGGWCGGLVPGACASVPRGVSGAARFNGVGERERESVFSFLSLPLIFLSSGAQPHRAPPSPWRPSRPPRRPPQPPMSPPPPRPSLPASRTSRVCCEFESGEKDRAGRMRRGGEVLLWARGRPSKHTDGTGNA